MENIDNKRKIAKKVYVKDLVSGTYIKRPGWEPSGVLTKYGEITRVNLIGLIVSLEETENTISFLLDDGSGNITIRAFEKPNLILGVGDLVRVVGRVRENNSEIFVVPEILKKTTKKWYDVHSLELKQQKKTSINLPVEESEEEAIETGPYQKILNVLAILDKGSGVDIQDIINNLKLDNCETLIRNLIEEGEIFEITPGRVKVLN